MMQRIARYRRQADELRLTWEPGSHKKGLKRQSQFLLQHHSSAVSTEGIQITSVTIMGHERAKHTEQSTADGTGAPPQGSGSWQSVDLGYDCSTCSIGDGLLSVRRDRRKTLPTSQSCASPGSIILQHDAGRQAAPLLASVTLHPHILLVLWRSTRCSRNGDPSREWSA